MLDFEQETLTKVIEARSKATSITMIPVIPPWNNSPSSSSGTGRTESCTESRLLVTERYPDLKANQNFLNCRLNWAGTENRINVARNDYNTAVKEYNTHIRRFPQSSWLACMALKSVPCSRLQFRLRNPCAQGRILIHARPGNFLYRHGETGTGKKPSGRLKS